MGFQSVGYRTSRGRMWAVALGVGLVGALVIGVIAASTAGNTVEETRAGVGQGSVTGYDITSVHYSLNSLDATKVDAVSFVLDAGPPAGTTVRIKLFEASPNWYDCTISGVSALCTTTSPQATVVEITELVVVAAQ